MDTAPRSPNGFLSSLTADDFELLRPHLRTADLTRIWRWSRSMRHSSAPTFLTAAWISLVVKLARGEHVQIAMVGRESIFGASPRSATPPR